MFLGPQRKAAMTATAAVSLHRVNKALVPLALLWGPSDAKDAKSKLQIASTAYMFGTSFGTSGAENASAFAISQVLDGFGWSLNTKLNFGVFCSLVEHSRKDFIAKPRGTRFEACAVEIRTDKIVAVKNLKLQVRDGTRWYAADRFHFTVFGRFKSSGVGDCQRVTTCSSLQVNPVSIFKEADLGMGDSGVLLNSAQV